ncbi:hypothetical protein, partial [Shigella flexneri]|uniref:hypothetical protein n=1 Tax=Shigella flexneri TaxID=623 RepID=UPI001C0A8270
FGPGLGQAAGPDHPGEDLQVAVIVHGRDPHSQRRGKNQIPFAAFFAGAKGPIAGVSKILHAPLKFF